VPDVQLSGRMRRELLKPRLCREAREEGRRQIGELDVGFGECGHGRIGRDQPLTERGDQRT
jgi:hypothetical protein